MLVGTENRYKRHEASFGRVAACRRVNVMKKAPEICCISLHFTPQQFKLGMPVDTTTVNTFPLYETCATRMSDNAARGSIEWKSVSLVARGRERSILGSELEDPSVHITRSVAETLNWDIQKVFECQ